MSIENTWFHRRGDLVTDTSRTNGAVGLGDPQIDSRVAEVVARQTDTRFGDGDLRAQTARRVDVEVLELGVGVVEETTRVFRATVD